jgi:4-amino-4-deoxy-L-arabinose transferase-like glycosyltransferase
MTNEPKQRRLGVSILISSLVFILLFLTAPDIGLTWDEPDYISASESYLGWFGQLFSQPGKAIQENSIEQAWSVNKEHPPLDKVWSGLFWVLTRNFTDDLTAHRVGNMFLVAFLAGFLYLLMSDAFGQVAGWTSVVSLLSMPRFFFHAHLAALDIPAAVSVFLVTFFFWKTINRTGRKWDLLLGLAWGLALGVKINAIFVPVTLGIWILILRRDALLIRRLVVMGFLGLVVFLLSWPWLYIKPIDHLYDYLAFITVDHWEIGQYYLGQFFMPPPWHFGFVMVLAVLPLGLTLLYFTGIYWVFKWANDKALGLLLFLSALTPILAISIGQTMVYDNERLMMATFPFLAALAGLGFDRVVVGLKYLSQRWNQPILRLIGVVILASLAFLPQMVTLIRMYPHLLSYYGEGVGGLRGATMLGLETTYWCESYSEAFPIINAQAKTGERVWADPWSHNVLIYYQMQGQLREDLVILAPMEVASVLGPDAPQPKNFPMHTADWFIQQHRQTSLGVEGENSPIIEELRRHPIVFQVDLEGIPIMTLRRK